MIPELTKELRLKIYQQALQIVTDFPEDTRGEQPHPQYFNLYQPAICIILLCIWNNIKKFREEVILNHYDEVITWEDTTKWFPEIADRVNNRCLLYIKDVQTWRKQTLNEAIDKLTQ